MLVDPLGRLLRVRVLPADIADAEGGLDLVADAARLFRRLRKLWVDSASAGSFADWAATVLGWEVEVVRRWAEQPGFAVQPKRWIVEKTCPPQPVTPVLESRNYQLGPTGSFEEFSYGFYYSVSI